MGEDIEVKGYPEPEEYIIRTITATTTINQSINLSVFANNIKINNNIIGMEYGKDRYGELKPKKNKKSKRGNTFYNQIMLNVDIGEKKINVKVFKNGTLHMTGLKKKKHGKKIIEIMKKELEKIYTLVSETCVENKSQLQVVKKMPIVFEKITIHMINSSFNSYIKINREKLYTILLNRDIFCTFEPCIHAAVNVKYDCCKKCVTILIFQTGKVIITGAKKIKHLKKTYEFINNIFKEKYLEIKK